MTTPAVIALLLASSSSGGTLAEPILVEARSNVYFSSREHTDSVTARITGATCEEAVFEISIRSGGEELFRRASQILTPDECGRYRREPEWASWMLMSIVNEVVGPVRAANRSCGPPPGCSSSKSFERLRRTNAPLVCFTKGSEGSGCVAFNPDTRKVEEVWSYSE